MAKKKVSKPETVPAINHVDRIERKIREVIYKDVYLRNCPEATYLETTLEALDLIRVGLEMRQEELEDDLKDEGED